MSDLDRLAQYHVEGRTTLPPEHKATPVVVAEPAPRQEQAGTDTSLEPPLERREDGPLSGPSVGPTAKPATAAKEAAGTHSNDDWPELPAFLDRNKPVPATEQGRG